MSTEIELKYLVFSPNAAELISTLLLEQHIEYIESSHLLANCYFDTPDLILRHHDMGLRIREKDGMLEQTIKTAGKVTGGLHQRPEFNVSVSSKQPDLSLFPIEIWAGTQQPSAIQPQLISLFSTDFKRQVWLINTVKGGVVEVVFDQGEVTSNGLVDPICEIELELVRGDVAELFDLAELFLTVLDLRPGLKSKAARGYALWQAVKPLSVLMPLTLLPLNNHNTLHDVFVNGMSALLNHLQKSVASYIEKPSLSALTIIKDTLCLMEHGFVFFEANFLTQDHEIKKEIAYFIEAFSWVEHLVYLREIINKTGNYRHKLNYSEALIAQLKLERRRFPNVEEVKQVLHSQRFNLFQLSMLRIVLSQKTLFNKKASEINIAEFASMQLSKSLEVLVNEIPENKPLSSENYLEKGAILNKSLHAGIWFSGLFDKAERVSYRAPWGDILEGIFELQVLCLIQEQLKRLPEQPEKLVRWQKSKVDTLVIALEFCKKSAMSSTPYWSN